MAVNLSLIHIFCDNYTVGERLDTADTLKASAGCHWFFHDGVQRYLFQSTLGEFAYGFVNVLVLTDPLVNTFLFRDDLAGSVWIQLVGRLCIQP